MIYSSASLAVSVRCLCLHGMIIVHCSLGKRLLLRRRCLPWRSLCKSVNGYWFSCLA